MADAGDLMFVYGTLRPSLATGAHARLVHDLEFLGPATVSGVLVDLGDYPGLVEGSGLVHGDLVRVADPARLAALDAYEECDSLPPLFHREPMVAHRPDGTTAVAWVYRYARPTEGVPVIVGGDYAKRRARR